jgi:hypothetical protein
VSVDNPAVASHAIDAVAIMAHAKDDDHARKPLTIPGIDDGEHLQPGDRVLLIIADDVQVARVVLDSAHDCGFKGVIAANPDSGLGLARKLRPAAIAIDTRTPDVHGWVVLDQLKHDGAARHIPVVVAADDDQRQRALKMGAIGHVGSPERTAMTAALDALARFLAQPRRLLIVEGDDRERDSLMAVIGSTEIATTAVATAEEALVVLGEHRFSCMVLDLGGPDMGSLELLHRIQRNEDLRELPIIVYTGRELTADEDAQLTQLAETILVKDVNCLERLLDETARYLHCAEAGLPEPQRRVLRELQASPSLHGTTVLVVDDDVRNIFAITSVLEAHHATIVSAENGRDGLRLLETIKVDIVLMDIMMPEMDGYTVIRKIRAEPRFAALPIIAVTAKAMKSDREKCIQAGASDYIAKPVDLDKLLSLLRVWLSN